MTAKILNLPHLNRYGWKPDLPDVRDRMFQFLHVAGLPASVDLRAFCPALYDQGQLGSCTANALCGSLEVLERIDGVKDCPMSRLFVYYNERAMEHTIGQDSGAQIRDGIKTLVKQGACQESLWPYDITKFTLKPPATAYSNGLNHQILSYARIDSLLALRYCLAGGYPVVFGFTVYESFESQKVALSGNVPMPQPGERVLGGHAVLAVGYDDTTNRVLVRNSWGASWGMGGYFWLPYNYVGNRALADDFWTIRKDENF